MRIHESHRDRTEVARSRLDTVRGLVGGQRFLRHRAKVTSRSGNLQVAAIDKHLLERIHISATRTEGEVLGKGVCRRGRRR